MDQLKARFEKARTDASAEFNGIIEWLHKKKEVSG
jgi:hypothetical protein